MKSFSLGMLGYNTVHVASPPPYLLLLDTPLKGGGGIWSDFSTEGRGTLIRESSQKTFNLF